ncbi:MAG TPA: SgcJ/EcaC family oxidoreductase [Candidatus Limnocylindrales bacterium]|nr:SgcJ/EcaC family oxidoreductase [Candidatus Limnocylindrales bacterium]
MKRTPIVVLAFCAMLGLGVASCAQKTTEDTQAQQKVVAAMQAQDETDIRAIDVAWAKAVASKDADQTASFYAGDGVLLAPGAPMASGKDAIRNTWAKLMGTPGFALSFAPTEIKISPSGDLAYEIGEYELTAGGKKGKPKTVKAKYVVVWGKQADGGWKALVDAPTTTQ